MPVHLQGDWSVACQLLSEFLVSFRAALNSNNVIPGNRKDLKCVLAPNSLHKIAKSTNKSMSRRLKIHGKS